MYSGKKWFKKVCIMILSVALLIGVPPMNHVEASSLSFAGKVYKADKQEELMWELYDLVNEERQKNGLSMLVMDQDLLETAVGRSCEITEKFDYIRADGSSCWTVYPDMTKYSMFAESYAKGYTDPKALLEALLKSANDKKRLLNTSYKSIGIGCIRDESGSGKLYWVLSYGGRVVKQATRPKYVKNTCQNTGIHKWDTGKVTTQPTCTDTGIRTYTCKECGVTKREILSTTAHTRTLINEIKPTCTTDGKSAGYKCTKCGKILQEQQTIPALGHTWDKGQVIKNPTDEEEGIIVYTCKTCGDTKTVEIHTNDDIEAPDVLCRTHVQTYGWMNWTPGGYISGTVGEGKRLESIMLKLDYAPYSGTIEYRSHVQSYGWQDWKQQGVISGTTGESKRIEAVQIRLTDEMADHFDVYYRVQAQSYGWLAWAKNGECAGTSGSSLRLEALQVVLVRKGQEFDKEDYDKKASVTASTKKTESMSYAAKTPDIRYRTHVQSYGWQGWKYNGAMSGTSGQAKRLEGIEIKLGSLPYDGGIRYKTHVQTYGWQNWKEDGAMSGTSGESKRLEAICIELTGDMAEHYDVYYRVHAQSYGWMGWAKNGEEAGTAGFAKRLEGIQIVLVPKDGAAPGKTYKGITSAQTAAYIVK